MRRGSKHTDAAKAKLRLATLGNQRARGATRSEETRRKLSAAHRGKVLSPEHKLKISEGLRRYARAHPDRRVFRDEWLRCRECRIEFRPFRPNQRYCSPKCRSRFADRPGFRRAQIIAQLEPHPDGVLP